VLSKWALVYKTKCKKRLITEKLILLWSRFLKVAFCLCLCLKKNLLNLSLRKLMGLDQRFSTWGTWGGYRGYARSPQGYAKFKKPHPNEAYLGRIFYLGVREGDAILIWGHAEGYNFDLGVQEYQKVENPWFRPLNV
jgi:hypothetical protein